MAVFGSVATASSSSPLVRTMSANSFRDPASGLPVSFSHSASRGRLCFCLALHVGQVCLGPALPVGGLGLREQGGTAGADLLVLGLGAGLEGGHGRPAHLKELFAGGLPGREPRVPELLDQGGRLLELRGPLVARFRARAAAIAR